MKRKTEGFVAADSIKNYNYLKENMLFACMWKERKEGGYLSSDWNPFVALKKVTNQGVEAFRGVKLDLQNHKVVVKDVGPGVEGLMTTYKPAARLFPEEEPGRLILMDNLDELSAAFLMRSDY